MINFNKRIFLLFLFFQLFFSSAIATSEIEKVRVLPYPFTVTTGITLEPVVTDGVSNITLEYRWFVNGEEVVHEISEHFSGIYLKRGDIISVHVIPVATGGIRLNPFVLSSLETSNAPPVITSMPPQELTEAGFSYQVSATDPDDDSLIFRLDAAPEGMTIDATTGLIQWRIETTLEGSFPVVIVVEDGFGGGAEQQFQLQLAVDDVVK